MNEQWLPVKGYEKIYHISSQCRLKSLSRRLKTITGYKITKEKILLPRDLKGVKYFHLAKNGNKKGVKACDLMKEYFPGIDITEPVDSKELHPNLDQWPRNKEDK